MKVVVAGGSGQVGTTICPAFQALGHEVIVLSRTPLPAPWKVVFWDARTLGEWAGVVDGADVVINLAGRSVNCRYGPKNRAIIRDSRMESTRVIGEAISRASRPPSLWLQASTATIYAHRFDAPNDEFSGVLGGEEPRLPDTWRFSVGVAKDWEKAANEAVTPRTRKVLMRSAIVMSPTRGGAFDILLGLVRHGMGGRAGSGRQFVSWIHDEDFVGALLWIIAHPELSGAINLASPNPLTNAEFMRELRKAWGVRRGLPATKWMLEFGSFFLRTESELVLKSRRVIPARLIESGFTFRYRHWHRAARNLCGRWRQIKSHDSGTRRRSSVNEAGRA